MYMYTAYEGPEDSVLTVKPDTCYKLGVCSTLMLQVGLTSHPECVV